MLNFIQSARLAPLLCALFALASASAYAVMPTGSIGAGLIVGEPTGFSGAYTLSSTNTLDGALAYSYVGKGDWQIHSDYLWTAYRVAPDQPQLLDTYFGGGLALKFEGPAEFGFRIPVGATYQFDSKTPLQFFGELAPILNIAPEVDVTLNIAVGARYFF